MEIFFEELFEGFLFAFGIIQKLPGVLRQLVGMAGEIIDIVDPNLPVFRYA